MFCAVPTGKKIYRNTSRFLGFFLTALILTLVGSDLLAAKQEKYDIIYLLTDDLERVLDYKEELEPLFDAKVNRKLKVVGRGSEYALIYDGNDSA